MIAAKLRHSIEEIHLDEESYRLGRITKMQTAALYALRLGKPEG
jgi:hypothetical protein